MAKKEKKKSEQAPKEETGPQEAQRLQREATTSRSGGPFGAPVIEQSSDSPQPGTEDAPDA